MDSSVYSLELVESWRLACGLGDGKGIHIWSLASYLKDGPYVHHKDTILALRMIADKFLASGSKDCTIRIWNVQFGSCLRTLIGHTGAVSALEKLSDELIASASHDYTIRVWHWASGRCVQTLTGHTSWVIALEVVSQYELASASMDQKLIVWNWNRTASKTPTTVADMVVAARDINVPVNSIWGSWYYYGSRLLAKL